MRSSGYFEGWYHKHQARGGSLAVIPGRADGGAFVQVVTDNGSYNISYPLSEYDRRDVLTVGGNRFSRSGVTLGISRPELTLTGEIRYTDLTPIRGDIMGPFRFIPMECRHEIVSMRHRLTGSVLLNGNTLDFSDGIGYIESDRGRSFPDAYAWVHCNSFEGDASIVASAARIPFCGGRFWGCICVVWLNGREYRLATYRGAKIRRCEPGILELRQGKYRLTVTADTHDGQPLAAPSLGAMDRVIYEDLSCPARFRFTEGGHVLLDETSAHTSYEYVG
ncbi:MAG: hypothetical protein LBH95_03000 [Oscillospiraceae bacterium]|jgi:hypothetical protein|nr:hypothetical protein [Oscillospiraceae bacterium]